MRDRAVRDGASRNMTIMLCLLLMTAVAVHGVASWGSPVSVAAVVICLVLLPVGVILHWRVWLEYQEPGRLGAGGQLVRGSTALLLLAVLPVLDVWGSLRSRIRLYQDNRRLLWTNSMLLWVLACTAPVMI